MAQFLPTLPHTLLPTDQYRYILAVADVTGLFISAAVRAVIEPLLPDLPLIRQVFVCDRDAGRFTGFSQLLSRSETLSTVSTHGH